VGPCGAAFPLTTTVILGETRLGCEGKDQEGDELDGAFRVSESRRAIMQSRYLSQIDGAALELF